MQLEKVTTKIGRIRYFAARSDVQDFALLCASVFSFQPPLEEDAAAGA
jgi:hypothetical protein